MFCRKCGAAVNGKFCSCCGQRVRSDLEEFRKIERKMKKEFFEACDSMSGVGYRDDLHWLAEACWNASSARYGKSGGYIVGDHVPASVFDSLQDVRVHAEKLFQALINF